MDKPFQRKGSKSNAQVGRDFESKVKMYFDHLGISLMPNISIEIGIRNKKAHEFDLGNVEKKILVECKSHTWTETEKVPSAKMTTWNQAMYFFYLAPAGYRKILFVLKNFSRNRNETLGQYYIRTNRHLIPDDVEIWELNEESNTAKQIK
jgi:hypothetical protein